MVSRQECFDRHLSRAVEESVAGFEPVPQRGVKACLAGDPVASTVQASRLRAPERFPRRPALGKGVWPVLVVAPVGVREALVTDNRRRRRRELLDVLRGRVRGVCGRPVAVGLDEPDRLSVGNVAGLALLAGEPVDVVAFLWVDKRVVRQVDVELVAEHARPDRAVRDRLDGRDELRPDGAVPVGRPEERGRLRGGRRTDHGIERPPLVAGGVGEPPPPVGPFETRDARVPMNCRRRVAEQPCREFCHPPAVGEFLLGLVPAWRDRPLGIEHVERAVDAFQPLAPGHQFEHPLVVGLEVVGPAVVGDRPPLAGRRPAADRVGALQNRDLDARVVEDVCRCTRCRARADYPDVHTCRRARSH